MVRVIIVDDDALVRSLLGRILTGSGIEVVGEADDGDKVVELVRRVQPDVILMDIRMQRMSGIEATKAVCALPDAPGIVALTSFDTKMAVLDAVNAGVAGFLAKDAAPEEIVQAIEQVARGDGALSARAARVVLEHMGNSVHQKNQAQSARLLSTLSEREREAAAGVAQGLSNSQIAGLMFISEATVKTQLLSAMQKTGASNRVQLAVVVAMGAEGLPDALSEPSF